MARFKTETRVIHNAGIHRVIGHSPSRKNRCAVVWDSLIERDYFLLLEHDPRVVRYVPQPETIDITLDPRWKSYTSDVLVVHEDGTLCRVEVKSDKAVQDPEIAARLGVIGVQYLIEGKDFRVVTASQIRVGKRVINLRALRHYTRVPLDEKSVSTVRSVLEANPGIQLNSAAGLIAALGVAQPLAVLYHMMFLQHIKFDLDGALIGPKTALYWREA